jgi:xylulokinase
MRTLILGIDSGTQSTKALASMRRDGKVLGSASQPYDLIPDLPPARRSSIRTRGATHGGGDPAGAARRASVRAEVKAIGISGQQHGLSRSTRMEK